MNNSEKWTYQAYKKVMEGEDGFQKFLALKDIVISFPAYSGK